MAYLLYIVYMFQFNTSKDDTVWWTYSVFFIQEEHVYIKTKLFSS